MKNNDRIKILTKNSSWIYLSKIITQILGFVVSILVIRKLAVETYGVYNFLLSTLIVFDLFAISPISSVLNRYIPELVQSSDFKKLKKFILSGLAISNVVLLVILIFIYFFQGPFGKFFNIPNFGYYFFAFILYVFVAYSKELMKSVISALLLHKTSSLLNIINSVISPVVYIYFLSDLNVILMLNIETVLAILYCIPTAFVLIKYYLNTSSTFEQKNSLVSRKRVIRYGLFSAFNELGSGIVGKTSDYFIISAVSSPYYVGLYAFAYKLYNIIYKILPLKDFLSVLRPLFIQKFTEKYKKEEFIQIYNFIIKIMLPVYMLPAIYFLIFGKGVINYVYDPKYIDAYWVTFVVMLSNVSIAFFYPQGLTIILKERMDIAFYSKIVVVFSIIAGIFGMKYFGIVGVAVVTMCGDFFRNILMHLMMRGKADMVYRFRELKNYLFISIFLFVLFYFTENLIYGLIPLIILSFLFALSACILIILFHPFNKKDLEILSRVSESSRILQKIEPVIVKIHSYRLKLGFIF